VTIDQTTGGAALPGDWTKLGATVDETGTNVAVWAPEATRVQVCLLDADGREQRVDLIDQRFHVWHGHLPGVGAGQRYGFRVDGPWTPEHGLRFNPAKLLLDPYARAVSGELRYDPAVFGHVRTSLEHSGDDRVRSDIDSAGFVPTSVVVDESFDWRGDTPPRIRWSDTILYELNVRGYTMRHPDVPPHLRGTYAGLAHPAVLEHLVSLGVTTVELMPVHHFVDEPHLAAHGLRNHWGYNSLAFFAPHAAYSASGSLGQQVSEFKAMVASFHEAGLEVVLDVVYNHTAEQGRDGPTLSLRGLANRQYYRLSRSGRDYVDYTGCGNTLDLRNPHTLQLVTDSLRYWVTEMHVDGFRFDLAAALARSMHDVDMLGAFFAVIQQDPVLREVKLIAEPWDVGPGGYQVGEFPSLWTEWNDRYRDTVRDFWRGAGDGVREMAMRVSGSSDLYDDDGRRPFASINFVTAHDGFTLRDLVSYAHRHNHANQQFNADGHADNRSDNYGAEGPTDDPQITAVRRRQIANMLTTLLLSTGVPMLTAGDEMGRTQQGNNNAYCQDNEVSWVDWEQGREWSDLTDLVRRLLRLRRENPVFRQRHFFMGIPAVDGGRKDIAWFGHDGHELAEDQWWQPDRRTLGLFLAGDAIRSRHRDGTRVTGDSFLLWLHAGYDHTEVSLPDHGHWAEGYRVVLDTGQPDREGTWLDAGSSLPLVARSAVLLRARDPEGGHEPAAPIA
jgi:glycogen operon protein